MGVANSLNNSYGFLLGSFGPFTSQMTKTKKRTLKKRTYDFCVSRFMILASSRDIWMTMVKDDLCVCG